MIEYKYDIRIMQLSETDYVIHAYYDSDNSPEADYYTFSYTISFNRHEPGFYAVQESSSTGVDDYYDHYTASAEELLERIKKQKSETENEDVSEYYQKANETEVKFYNDLMKLIEKISGAEDMLDVKDELDIVDMRC